MKFIPSLSIVKISHSVQSCTWKFLVVACPSDHEVHSFVKISHSVQSCTWKFLMTANPQIKGHSTQNRKEISHKSVLHFLPPCSTVKCSFSAPKQCELLIGPHVTCDSYPVIDRAHVSDERTNFSTRVASLFERCISELMDLHSWFWQFTITSWINVLHTGRNY